MNNEINIENIKKLRTFTGAGISLCKKALTETNGDFEKAILVLEKNGILIANKKLTRITKEGIIFAYIHSNQKVGVLLELNCETDFVAKRPEFKDLAKIIAMQIVSTEKNLFISLQEIPSDIKQKENEIIKDELNLKKELTELNILEKRLESYLLNKQPLIINENILVEDYIKSYISLLGENIKINRFVKYFLDEKSI